MLSGAGARRGGGRCERASSRTEAYGLLTKRGSRVDRAAR
jgi:hypothetical protein